MGTNTGKVNKDEKVTEPSCGDVNDPSLSVNEAKDRIISSINPLSGSETISLSNALGRVLAQEVISKVDVPSGRNSAMDGYAYSTQALSKEGKAKFSLVGTILAGSSSDIVVQSGECVRIMTGALLPPGTDTVVIQERTKQVDKKIYFSPNLRAGDNVREKGEDIRKNVCILSAGVRLSPADIGLIASAGVANICVKKTIRVAFFSTGDELCSLGEPLQPNQIYDSNRYTLLGMLLRLGVEVIDLGVVRDNPEQLRKILKQAATQADVVISSGGVSVGEADYVKETLTQIGQIDFWKIAMKPGRPLTFGRLNEAYFFGLPGNPVSVMVTFYQFVQPALQYLQGEVAPSPLLIKARCVSLLKKRIGRTEFQRGVLYADESNQLIVKKEGDQGSGILSSMSKANCFIILENNCEDIKPNQVVTVQPFMGLI